MTFDDRLAEFRAERSRVDDEVAGLAPAREREIREAMADSFLEAWSKGVRSKMSSDNLIAAVTQWAKDRDIPGNATAQSQVVKLTEELGELAAGVCRGDLGKTCDSIGDMTVVLIVLCSVLGVDFGGCLRVAYETIKDRKGRMVDGVFVKEGD